MTTARTIVKKAMQKAGVLFINSEPTAEEANDGLDSLNAMLSSWSNDELMCYVRVRETFTLTTGVYIYTIGPGADFDTIRPMFIMEAHLTNNQVNYPLFAATDEYYESLPNKQFQGYPQFYNYNNGFATGTISFYSNPCVDFEFHLLSEKELAQFTLDDDVDLPPGWERALIYNLAIEIAGEYGVEPQASVVNIAGKALSQINVAVAKARTMDYAPLSGYRGNIYNGWYFR